MHPDSFRFHPPARDLPAELDWTLSRAFGPLPGGPIELGRPQAALDWAGALGLRERIAGRLPRSDAENELPAAMAEELRAARDALAARGLLLRRLLDRVVGVAAELGIPVVALKGIALLESGISDWGSRPLLDLDLLVPEDRAAELQGSLCAAGLAPSGGGERHHLPPLADRRLGEVELHLHLPGVAVGGAGPATAGELVRAGLTHPAERLAGLELPIGSLLAAHAVAHALDQHGLSPTAYPVTRLLADLADLGEEVDPALVGDWTRGSISARERQAAGELLAALRSGDPVHPGSDARALLDHTVEAVSSPRYRRRLRRRSALRALRRRQWSKFRSELYRRVQAYRGLE